MVSVDHAVWLHRAARADEWLVHSLVHAAGRGTIRGVLHGRGRRMSPQWRRSCSSASSCERRPKQRSQPAFAAHALVSGHYSNSPEALEAVLGALRERLSWRREPAISPFSRRLGNGVIQRPVVNALTRADCPMDIGEAHAAVEELLGHSVPRGSITSCLSTGARAGRLGFDRVARGRYQLARTR